MKKEKKLDFRQAIKSLPMLAVSLNLNYDESYLKKDLERCHRCENTLNFTSSLKNKGSIVLCISNKLSKLFPYIICDSCTIESNKDFSSAIGEMNIEILELIGDTHSFGYFKKKKDSSLMLEL